jgi:hypothetical protein
MKAILRYVQKVIASKKDGTISITIDTGEVATLTVKNRSIVAASLEDSSGKEALEAIKLATIVHMEFWKAITQKSDIQKMIHIQAETNALSPIPEDEMHPEGTPLVEYGDHEDATAEVSESEHETTSVTIGDAEEPAHLTEKDVEALSDALTEFIGPAASILVETTIEQARDMNHLIALLSEELFTEQDRENFSRKAYFLLGQT